MLNLQTKCRSQGCHGKAPGKFGFDLKNLGTNIDNLAEDFKVLCPSSQDQIQAAISSSLLLVVT